MPIELTPQDVRAVAATIAAIDRYATARRTCDLHKTYRAMPPKSVRDTLTAAEAAMRNHYTALSPIAQAAVHHHLSGPSAAVLVRLRTAGPLFDQGHHDAQLLAAQLGPLAPAHR